MKSPADDVRSEALDPEFAGTVSGLLDAVTSLSSDLDTRSEYLKQISLEAQKPAGK